MKKIISLFQRNYDGDRQVRNEVTPGAEWVLAGEGVATRKYDGTCCLIRGDKLYKRYESRVSREKLPLVVYVNFPPQGFEPVTEPDPITGKQQGWVPVGDGPEDQYHREAWKASGENLTADELVQGTCELVGPKINGNHDNWHRHWLVMHSNAEKYPHCPRDFNGIREFLKKNPIEGIVWHHPDGRMVKIKAKDFGIAWPRRRKEE